MIQNIVKRGKINLYLKKVNEYWFHYQVYTDKALGQFILDIIF